MDDNQFLQEISKIKPWNSSSTPIKVNSIRYNQDFSLLTLGTSKGYRIFLTSNLKQCNEETEINDNFGDIGIAMTYFNSSLIFLLPSYSNEKYSNRELIIFDDFYQSIIASFKDAKREIINFFLSKNILFIINTNRIIIIELFTFRIIEIIESVCTNNKLLSYNFLDYISFTFEPDKKFIHIYNYINNNYKITYKKKSIIKLPFDFVQVAQISPLGDLIGIISIFGNKMHLYYTQTGKLKECIYLGSSILTIEKMYFSQKKQNYIFIITNNDKYYIYKSKKIEDPKCICENYNDKSMINGELVQEEKPSGFFGFFRKYSKKNKDIKEIHAFFECEGRILFSDFDRNKNKDLIIIKYDGEFIKYRFIKKSCGNISPFVKIQWL